MALEGQKVFAYFDFGLATLESNQTYHKLFLLETFVHTTPICASTRSKLGQVVRLPAQEARSEKSWALISTTTERAFQFSESILLTPTTNFYICCIALLYTASLKSSWPRQKKHHKSGTTTQQILHPLIIEMATANQSVCYLILILLVLFASSILSQTLRFFLSIFVRSCKFPQNNSQVGAYSSTARSGTLVPTKQDDSLLVFMGYGPFVYLGRALCDVLSPFVSWACAMPTYSHVRYFFTTIANLEVQKTYRKKRYKRCTKNFA